MTTGRHLIVAGSRDYTDLEAIRAGMNAEWKLHRGFDSIISGMARGVDIVAHGIATQAGITVQEMPADWNKFGKSAGYRRNKEMADRATHLLAFWDGRSKGTKHMIDLARDARLRITVVRTDDPKLGGK